MSRTSQTGRSRRFRRMPRKYAALVAMLPPRPIRDRVDLANAVERIDRLAGFELNADQEDYLEALSTFVEAYEREHCPIDDAGVTPLEALKYLMEENGMTHAITIPTVPAKFLTVVNVFSVLVKVGSRSVSSSSTPTRYSLTPGIMPAATAAMDLMVCMALGTTLPL